MSTELDIFSSQNAFEAANIAAKAVANSELIPDHLRGKVPDVLMAVDLARRLGMPPLHVLRSLYPIGGKIGWKAEFIIALARQGGWSIEYEVQETEPPLQSGGKKYPNMSVCATLVHDQSGQRKVGMRVTMQQAIDAGWARNPQYSHSAGLMLRYRAATFCIRLHEPGLLMGMHTTEELADVRASGATERTNERAEAEVVVPAGESVADRETILRAISELGKQLPEEKKKEIRDHFTGGTMLRELPTEKLAEMHAALVEATSAT